MKNNTNKEVFNVIVWYRTVRNGEIEKDFTDLKIEADNIQEAINQAANKFNGYKSIPFSFEYNGKKYTPNNFDKTIFN